ncbi:MAG TPA: ribonuclease HI family protein [Candidatus Paceibacterota bacterium]|jgi:ribonuclease HI|nr:ribonuclease HI family protein [Candidatus Paceibacterota bacterium]HRS48006.1 ribonuclease HI family protein [Candidatus Paceibacterota bacterium]
MAKKIIIYTDGGSRGNPGKSALGVVIKLSNSLKTYSKFLGKATNNEAEYQAVIFALKKLKSLISKKQAKNTQVVIKTDSELMAKQLTGKYKLKDKDLIPLFVEIWNLKQDFLKVEFEIIKREQNKLADKLVNQELDKVSQI